MRLANFLNISAIIVMQTTKSCDNILGLGLLRSGQNIECDFQTFLKITVMYILILWQHFLQLNVCKQFYSNNI